MLDYLDWKNTLYTLTDKRIIIKRGLFEKEKIEGDEFLRIMNGEPEPENSIDTSTDAFSSSEDLNNSEVDT